MLINDLKTTYWENKDKNPLFVRNLLKQTIQYYILSFVGQSVWADKFIFKGGTCLKICFDLPRLSEDLDFDILDYENFELNPFIAALKKYFTETLQFSNLEIKQANNKRTIYLKFPVLKAIGVVIDESETNTIFVRLDLAPVVGKKFKTEISIKSKDNFYFLIKRYSLPDLLTGKILAILTRQAFEGKTKKERFKGRDFFDLIWFLEKSVSPNWDYLQEILKMSKKEIIKKIDNKVKEANPVFLESDLKPFLSDQKFVKDFISNFQKLYKNYKKIMVGK